MKRSLVGVLATAAILAAAAAAPGTAAAAGHHGAATVAPMPAMSAAPPVAFLPPVTRAGIHPDTPNSQCLATNHNLCMTNKNGNVSVGNPISGSAQTGNSNQHWVFTLTSSCGDGHVHASDPPGPGTGPCPFPAGSGLNSAYNNEDIVTACLLDFPLWCWAVNDPTVNGNMTLQHPTATGTNWILDTDGTVTGWVNKSRTAFLGNTTGCRATTDGTLGDQLSCFINNVHDADAQWVTLLGV